MTVPAAAVKTSDETPGLARSSKREPVSALEDDYNAIMPSSKGKNFKVQALAENDKDMKPAKLVASSMNSIAAERSQRTQDNGSEFTRRKFEPAARVTMPLIAQTPQVGLSSKYSQANFSQAHLERLQTMTKASQAKQNTKI